MLVKSYIVYGAGLCLLLTVAAVNRWKLLPDDAFANSFSGGRSGSGYRTSSGWSFGK